MNETSLSLLQRITQQGNDNDWKRLIDIYRPFIFKKVSTYPLLVDQADDIVQETLMVLMRELPAFQRRRAGSFRAWLRAIVLNQLRYATRRAKRTPLPAGQSEVMWSRIEDLADPNSEATRSFDSDHDKAVFRRASEIVRSEIKPTTWQAFQKHAINGEDARDVAKRLDVSVNVVLLAKSRVTRRIREEIAGLIDED